MNARIRTSALLLGLGLLTIGSQNLLASGRKGEATKRSATRKSNSTFVATTKKLNGSGVKQTTMRSTLTPTGKTVTLGRRQPKVLASTIRHIATDGTQSIESVTSGAWGASTKHESSTIYSDSAKVDRSYVKEKSDDSPEAFQLRTIEVDLTQSRSKPVGRIIELLTSDKTLRDAFDVDVDIAAIELQVQAQVPASSRRVREPFVDHYIRKAMRLDSLPTIYLQRGNVRFTAELRPGELSKSQVTVRVTKAYVQKVLEEALGARMDKASLPQGAHIRLQDITDLLVRSLINTPSQFATRYPSGTIAAMVATRAKNDSGAAAILSPEVARDMEAKIHDLVGNGF